MLSYRVLALYGTTDKSNFGCVQITRLRNIGVPCVIGAGKCVGAVRFRSYNRPIWEPLSGPHALLTLIVHAPSYGKFERSASALGEREKLKEVKEMAVEGRGQPSSSMTVLITLYEGNPV